MPGPSRQSVLVAAPREFEAAEEHAHLLRIVHAVEHDDRRLWAVTRRLHEQRGERGALIRHLDEFDVGMAQPDALVPDLVGVRALGFLLGARRDETLGVVMIDAGADIIVAGGHLAASGQRRVALFFDLVAERAPLFEPRLATIRLALPRAQLLAGAIHLLERYRAVGRHALEDEGRVRPQKVVAEMVDPGAAGHSRCPFVPSVGPGRPENGLDTDASAVCAFDVQRRGPRTAL